MATYINGLLATAHISTAVPGGGVATLQNYLTLVKPRVVGLVLFTSVVACFAAAGGSPPPSVVLILLASGFLAAGGAAALNHYLDRDVDVKMERTRGRPLAAGRIRHPALVMLGGLAMVAVGVSWAQFGDAGEWAGEAAPGEENVRAAAPQAAGDDGGVGFGVTGTGAGRGSSTGAADDGGSSAAGVMAIAQARGLDKGAAVRVQGQVTALPGVFDDTYMYIADGSGGIQVYFSKMQWPELEEGWGGEGRGKISEAHGEKKLNVATGDDIEVVETDVGVVVPVAVTAADEVHEGQLVRAEGKVSGKTRTKFALDRLVVAVKKATGISLTAVNEGEARVVVGIMTQQKEEYQLWPRSQADMQAGGGGEGVAAGGAGAGGEGASGTGVFGGSQDGYHFFGSSGGAGQPAAKVWDFVRAHPWAVGAGFTGLVVAGVGVYFLERKYHFLAKYFRPKAA